AEVAFGEWTADGKMRHPSFQGLREDKPADQVGREQPAPTKSVDPAAPPASPASRKRERVSPARSRTPHSTRTRLDRPERGGGKQPPLSPTLRRDVPPA